MVRLLARATALGRWTPFEKIPDPPAVKKNGSLGLAPESGRIADIVDRLKSTDIAPSLCSKINERENVSRSRTVQAGRALPSYMNVIGFGPRI
jgi:hypothetical protein